MSHGRAPVKLVDADPSREHLDGAASDVSGRSVYVDENQRIKIRLIEKIGRSYCIAITPL